MCVIPAEYQRLKNLGEAPRRAQSDRTQTLRRAQSDTTHKHRGSREFLDTLKELVDFSLDPRLHSNSPRIMPMKEKAAHSEDSGNLDLWIA